MRVIGSFGALKGQGFVDVEVNGEWHTICPDGKSVYQADVSLFWEITEGFVGRFLILNVLSFI